MTVARVGSAPFGRPRAFRDGLRIAGVIYLVWVWQFLLAAGTHVDVDAYWRAAQGDPYAFHVAGQQGAMLYSPVAAEFLDLIGRLPIAVFVGGLLAASLAAAVYLVGPEVAALVLLIPLPYVWQDLSSGNIHIIVAAAIVIGFRYPAAWSFVILTKLTPGVGLLWFAFRREWKALLIAMTTSALLAGISFLIAPNYWFEWIRVLQANLSVAPEGTFIPVGLPIRLLIACAILWWGATSGRAWTVPLAAMLALPVIWVFDGFAMLLGVVSLLLRPIDTDKQTDASPNRS